MSYLLFLDESGHDHRTMPYEVHGGFALHANKLWRFVQAIVTLEQVAFGDSLRRYQKEIKGCKLLDKDRFRWALQSDIMDDVARRNHCLSFLKKGLRKQSPTRDEFTAYGQASLLMARGIFEILKDFDALIFAAAIPRNTPNPPTTRKETLLRKDLVFLLERYFYLLEDKREAGLIVLDESEKQLDRGFVQQLERYFQTTQVGRYRSSRIVPSPFFVASDMSYPVQVADVCVYTINHGFRLPRAGMDLAVRSEIAKEFGESIRQLQYKGEGYREGEVFKTYGIVFVPDLYMSRAAEETYFSEDLQK